MKRIYGFTLAEVLITLVIIGVIAALTIPNLMQSYRKHQVEVGLKEAYSILSNAFRMAQTQGNGDVADMVDATFNQTYVNASDFFSENYLLPYLKVQSTCPVNETSASCKIFDYSFKFFDGHTVNALMYNPLYMFRILLNNGMTMAVYTYRQNSENNVSFWVDINGAKGPNKMAVDIFLFSVDGSKCNYTNSYYCPRRNFLAGSSGSSLYTQSGYKKDCRSDYILSCAGVIMQNGWKIPDDYPVKKW